MLYQRAVGARAEDQSRAPGPGAGGVGTACALLTETTVLLVRKRPSALVTALPEGSPNTRVKSTEHVLLFTKLVTFWALALFLLPFPFLFIRTIPSTLQHSSKYVTF